MLAVRVICDIVCVIIGCLISSYLQKRHDRKEAQKELARIEAEKKRAKSEKVVLIAFKKKGVYNYEGRKTSC